MVRDQKDFEVWLKDNPAHDVQVSRLVPLELGVRVEIPDFSSDPADSVYRLHDPTTGIAAEISGRLQALAAMEEIRERLFLMVRPPVFPDDQP